MQKVTPILYNPENGMCFVAHVQEQLDHEGDLYRVVDVTEFNISVGKTFQAERVLLKTAADITAEKAGANTAAEKAAAEKEPDKMKLAEKPTDKK